MQRSGSTLLNLAAHRATALLAACCAAGSATAQHHAAPHRREGAVRSTAHADFTGNWSWSAPDGRATFDLTLRQRGRRLTGYHCAVAQGGNRIDCTEEDEPSSGERPSIHGTAHDAHALVRFQSRYSLDAGGTARLDLRNGYLTWRILREHGDHYLPERATLKREADRGLAKGTRLLERRALRGGRREPGGIAGFSGYYGQTACPLPAGSLTWSERRCRDEEEHM